MGRAVGVAVIFAILGTPAFADPMIVSYTVPGSPGSWTLDFSVTNNMTATPDQNLLLFGVYLNSIDMTGTPANFRTFNDVSWTVTRRG